MAGNFWQSSHYQQWLLERQDIMRERGPDIKALGGEESDYQKVMIYFTNLIQAIGENLKLRQQVIATGTVYFKRFYARNSLKCIDPLLLAPTCLLLASKVEEFGLLSPNKVIQACWNVVKDKDLYSPPLKELPYTMKQVHEAEFFLLEMMDCCLIVYHPYRPLLQFLQDLNNDDQLLSLSWKIINDSLRTDVALIYPPYQIALAAIHMASVVLNTNKESSKEAKMMNWFAELAVDMEKVLEIIRHILSLYQLWKSFDQKSEMKKLLERLPKPQTSSSRPESCSQDGQ